MDINLANRPRTRKASTKKKTKRTESSDYGNPKSSVTIYKGPLLTRDNLLERALQTYVFGYNGPVTSSAGGVIANVYSDAYSNLSNITNFSDVAGAYAECRVLACRLQYFPYNRYSKTTTTCTPGVRTLDRANGTALTSIDDGQVHESAKVMSLEDPWTELVKMNGVADASFQPVGSFASTFWIKLYATGLTVSTSYGQVFLTYRVQFRGHPS